MICMECGATAEKGYTTDVVQHLEKIVEMAKNLMQEVSIIDYSKVA